MVRDREPAALQDPPPVVFEGFGRVRYLHVSDLGDDLPPARHYIFNCNDFDAATQRPALAAAGSGARLTFITQCPAPGLTRLVRRHDVGLIPSHGVDGQITAATSRSVMRQVLHGCSMRAEAFLAHSGMQTESGRPGGAASFLGILAEASAAASRGARVVAAVLWPCFTSTRCRPNRVRAARRAARLGSGAPAEGCEAAIRDPQGHPS